VIWLSTYMIHHANNIRPKLDGLKVGGHQASSTSLSTLMTYLYMRSMEPQDRCAVKPHAGPVFHALQYLQGQQTLEQLQLFRSMGGVQSYPSRTKDSTEVDFSTGSVGLGAAVTTFTATMQDFLDGKGLRPKLVPEGARLGRMIALVGDAELDEGNVYECLLESQKLSTKNNWWFVDYNRQSLDKVIEEVSGRKTIATMFKAAGWEVVTLKYGRQLQEALAWPTSGRTIQRWMNTTSNQTYSDLVFLGGAAFREQMLKDIGQEAGVAEQLAAYSDEQLFSVVTDLGGHCFETIAEGFAHAETISDRPVVFIAYTVKGHGLATRGHPDNHGSFLNTSQVDELRVQHGVGEGQEWEPYAGIAGDGELARRIVEGAPLAKHGNKEGSTSRNLEAPVIAVPELAELFSARNLSKDNSTQAAFGECLTALARGDSQLADRIVTTAPDVTTSTNLSGFLNQRGQFAVEASGDQAEGSGVMSVNKWVRGPTGQHIELGIAENNLFLLLAAAGLTAPIFGHRLLPVGTLYDPFIARGLDALNYGCYMDSRFMVVATPSGITLGPEGGAHQSINTPLIGMGQPNLLSYEPATTDELLEIMKFSFGWMQEPKGSSIYLRLSTRTLPQPERELSYALKSDIVEGGYWHGDGPSADTKCVVVFAGAILPEVQEAMERVRATVDPQAALLQVTSTDRLQSGWNEEADGSHVGQLLAGVPAGAALVTVIDAHPASLSWLGAVHGHRVRGLGVNSFGQSGNLPDLYAHYKIGADAVVEAAASFINK